MKLLQWTLFIDMLGYREANGSINSDKNAEDFIGFMESNKNILDFSNREEIREQYKERNFNLYKYYDIDSCFVSDSIIITYKPKEVEEPKNGNLKFMHSANALFIICMRLQTIIYNCFTERGIFLRGGISSKYSYIKESFAVGEGVIEAYLAESSIAKHPRIALHPNIEENQQVIDCICFLSDNLYGGKSLIKRDSKDGILFLDYIGNALALADPKSQAVAHEALSNPITFSDQKVVTENYICRHYEALSSKLHELTNSLKEMEADSEEYEKTARVLEKFNWLKEYHNQSIAGIEGLKHYIVG